MALNLVLKTSGTERYGDRYLRLPQQYLGVAQFGRAGSLGLSGRRFDPCHLDNVFVAQLVLEHSAFNGGVTGSSPVGDTNGRVEQLVGSADCKSVAKALGVRIPPLPQKRSYISIG